MKPTIDLKSILEKGTDIKYIKDILGHFDIRTTECYLPVNALKASSVIIAFVLGSLNATYYAREKIMAINEVISQLKKFKPHSQISYQ